MLPEHVVNLRKLIKSSSPATDTAPEDEGSACEKGVGRVVVSPDVVTQRPLMRCSDVIA